MIHTPPVNQFFFNDVHPSKDISPIVFTVDGILMFCNALQYLNAPSDIFLIPSGIYTLTIYHLFRKAFSPITSMSSGISTFLLCPRYARKIFFSISKESSSSSSSVSSLRTASVSMFASYNLPDTFLSDNSSSNRINESHRKPNFLKSLSQSESKKLIPSGALIIILIK